MTDYDATTRISEENRNATIRSPVAISQAVIISGILGWMLNVTFGFCVGDLTATLTSTPSNPVAQIFNSVCRKGSLAMWFCVLMQVKSGPLALSRRVRHHPSCELCGVPGLHEDCARSSEFAHEAFAGREVRHHAATGDTLHDVLQVPRYQLAVVDNILLVWLKLRNLISKMDGSEMYGSTTQTSFRMIAPKLVTQRTPLPLTL